MVFLVTLLPTGKRSCLHLVPSRRPLEPATYHKYFAADRSGAIMKHPRAPGKHHLSPRSESWTLKEWGDDFWPPKSMEEKKSIGLKELS